MTKIKIETNKGIQFELFLDSNNEPEEKAESLAIFLNSKKGADFIEGLCFCGKAIHDGSNKCMHDSAAKAAALDIADEFIVSNVTNNIANTIDNIRLSV